jgi:hypothetical protein
MHRKLIGLLKVERKKQLPETQRLWGKVQRSKCAFCYDPDGGTMA